jgi:adenylate cyclase
VSRSESRRRIGRRSSDPSELGRIAEVATEVWDTMSMSPFVLRVDHRTGPQHYSLPEGRPIIGRGKGCDIVLDDASVSREHAALEVTNDGIEVVDLQSSNGTSVNGQRIQRAKIGSGDNLMFGEVPGAVERVQEYADVFAETRVFRDLGDVTTVGALAPVIDAPRLIRLLSEIARTLIARLTLPETLTRVFELLFAHIRAERASLLMVDAATGQLTPVVVRRSDGRPAQQPVVSRTVLEAALGQRVAIMALDALVDTRFDEALTIHGAEVRSLMCAPLFATDELIGALYVDNRKASQFSEADLELFTALANYAAVAIAQARLAEELLEERQRRERLQRYHSPAIVDRICARQTGDGVLAAQEVEISVMFADIVEFTTLAESMRPADVGALLNAFFSRMVEAIFAEEGTVDKFLGDAILGIFGAPVGQPDHALRAVRAAQAMRRVVTALNAETKFPQVRVRYTINSGVAIAGDFGSAKRQEYTVLGDVVNIAARLKTVAEPDQLVVSRATYDRLGSPISATSLGYFVMRGRTGKVEAVAIDP